MSLSLSSLETPAASRPKIRVKLGGFAALAESAWMGFPQATEVLDALRHAQGASLRAIVPRIPRLSLRSLFTREYTVAEASFILMASFFTSALLGAIRQVLFNSQFGVGMEANAYYAAFRLPDTLFSLIAGGALSSAMIPVLLSARQEAGDRGEARLTHLVLTTLLAVFIVIVLLAMIFTPGLVRQILAPGFDQETSQLTITLTRMMLLQPLILVVASVATALLNSRNQFLLTGLSILCHNVALIAGIAVSRMLPALGIYGPTLGVVLGAILQVAVLAPGLNRVRGGIRLAWDPANRRLREVLRLLAPNGLSVGVNYTGNIADTAFATLAVQGAALGAIYNAWLLVGLPIALLGQAIGQAAFPRLAAHAETGAWAALRRTLWQSLGAAVAMSLVALGGLVWLGRPVIRILFERGEFTATAGELTYLVLLAYAVALPAYVATEVISRGLIALRDTRTPLFTNIFQLAGRIAIMALFVGQYGAIVVPIALAITASIETMLLGAVLLRSVARRG
jgi:putative peptidoglycan lipid II flippase